MKRLIALAVVVFFITSCPTREQQAQTEGTAVGALGGALLGAAIGGIATRSAKGAGIGAGIGLLTGGVAGFVYANSIVKQREELAGKEDDLDAQIKFARGFHADTKEYNRKLANDLETFKSDIARLDARNRNETAENEKLLAKRQQLDEKIKTAEADL